MRKVRGRGKGGAQQLLPWLGGSTMHLAGCPTCHAPATRPASQLLPSCCWLLPPASCSCHSEARGQPRLEVGWQQLQISHSVLGPPLQGWLRPLPLGPGNCLALQWLVAGSPCSLSYLLCSPFSSLAALSRGIAAAALQPPEPEPEPQHQHHHQPSPLPHLLPGSHHPLLLCAGGSSKQPGPWLPRLSLPCCCLA